MLSELQLNSESRRAALSGGKLQSFTLLSFVITSGSRQSVLIVWYSGKVLRVQPSGVVYLECDFDPPPQTMNLESHHHAWALSGVREGTLCSSRLATQQGSCDCPFVLAWLDGEWKDPCTGVILLPGFILQEKKKENCFDWTEKAQTETKEWWYEWFNKKTFNSFLIIFPTVKWHFCYHHTIITLLLSYHIDITCAWAGCNIGRRGGWCWCYSWTKWLPSQRALFDTTRPYK